MDIEKMISELPQASLKSLKDRLANVNRVLARDARHADASRLRSAIEAELIERKMANRKKVGQLWWEPRDSDFPETNAYETANSVVSVATIFKSDTHTATRKDVYSVRVHDRELPGLFSEIDVARRAGSEAWEKSKRS